MSWVGGLAEWQVDDTVYLSIAFTWKLDEAYSRALFARAQGLKVMAGGPALFLLQNRHKLADVAAIPLKPGPDGRPIGADYQDAVARHNPDATFASRGCPLRCHFCIVWKMEGNAMTAIPDFPVRPVLCDNNLSALPPDFQDYIIRRYQDAGVRMTDASSGFEPLTFTPDVYERWKPLINAGGGPWRFAYDMMLNTAPGKTDGEDERREALRVMRMLADEPQRRKRVYVLIGNEPFAECMQRIQEVIDNGCEPHVQPFIKLNALERVPHARFDWTVKKLKDVARWANHRIWKYAPFSEYDSSVRTGRGARAETYDAQQGLFL